MTRFIETEVGKGEIIRIEVEPVTPPTGVVPAARPEELAAKAREVFEEAMDTIRITATSLVKTVQEMADLPDQVKVRFGVKIDAEVGAMIAKAGMEAHYLVTLIWERTTLQAHK